MRNEYALASSWQGETLAQMAPLSILDVLVLPTSEEKVIAMVEITLLELGA